MTGKAGMGTQPKRFRLIGRIAAFLMVMGVVSIGAPLTLSAEAACGR